MTYRQVAGGLGALVAFLAGGIATVDGLPGVHNLANRGRAPLATLRSVLAAGDANLNAINPHAYPGLHQETSGGRRLLSTNADDLVSSDR